MSVKLRPFLKDVSITFLTSIIVSISSVIATRFFAQGMGPVEFGAYSLARRVALLITAFSSLDMGVSAARYLGLSQRDNLRRGAYFIGATGIVLCATLIVCGLGLVMITPLSFWIFSDNDHESLTRALLFMAAGYGMYALVYAYYRGIGQMTLANLWHFILLTPGLLAVAILFARGGKATQITFYIGCVFMLGVPLICYICIKSLRYIKRLIDIIEASKELFIYGCPRTLAGFGYQGFFCVGPFLASQVGTLSDAGYIVVSQYLFMLLETALGSFGLVVLPKAAQLYADNKIDYLKKTILDILTFVFQIGLFCTIHLYLWSDLMIQVWLGDSYEAAIPLTRILTISLIPYMCYPMLRSIIDAIEVKPINTINLLFSLSVTILIGIILGVSGFGIKGIATSITLGFSILGMLTIMYLSRYYQLNLRKCVSIKVLLVNILIFLPAYGVHRWEFIYSGGLFPLATAFCFELFLVILYASWIYSMYVNGFRQMN